MKKILCLLLSLAMLLSFAACNGGKSDPQPKSSEPAGTADAAISTEQAGETGTPADSAAPTEAAPAEEPYRLLFNGNYYVQPEGSYIEVYEYMRDKLGEVEDKFGRNFLIYGNAAEETPTYIRLVLEEEGLLRSYGLLRLEDHADPTPENNEVTAVYIAGYRYDAEDPIAQKLIAALYTMVPSDYLVLGSPRVEVGFEYDGHMGAAAWDYMLYTMDNGMYLSRYSWRTGNYISLLPVDIDVSSLPRRDFLTQPSIEIRDDTLTFASHTWRIDRENMTTGPDPVTGWDEFKNNEFFGSFDWHTDRDKYTCEIEIDGTLYTANVLYKYYEGKNYRDLTHPYLVVIDGYFLRFQTDLEPENTPQEELDYYINDTDFYIFPLILAD